MLRLLYIIGYPACYIPLRLLLSLSIWQAGIINLDTITHKPTIKLMSKIEQIKNLLEKQETKLTEMQSDMDDLASSAPFLGSMGTPFTDNSKGRQYKKRVERWDKRMWSINEKIKEQKEKIERTKSRIAWHEGRQGVTKFSAKYLEKNEIHAALISLEEKGKLSQWKRNPHVFFVVGLEKTALFTKDGKICASARFNVKSEDDLRAIKEMLKDVSDSEKSNLLKNETA